jgi:glycerol kinase
MSVDDRILAIDQGTTSSRAIVFDGSGATRAVAQRELGQGYPRPGWVEHDPEAIWDDVLAVCREALAAGGPVAGIGITNQRETTVVWDRESGKPVYPAIVWQDRRTADRCEALRARGLSGVFRERTGLVLDPYFSGTKIAWILDHVDGARARAQAGELAFGTVDTWLVWRLTGGAVHATDATNASRTLLFDIPAQAWDEELLAHLGVPRPMLPDVRDSAADFGIARAELLGAALPVTGVAGDQQAATVGQACFRPGMVKSTYGTGCFAVMNTGTEAVPSHHGLLTTVAYRLDGRTTYALEGSIFAAGAAVQWLRDALRIIDAAAQTEGLAGSLKDNDGVYLVPAFVGLGAPHWDPHARGAVVGLSRDTGIAHFARAALESVCYQTHDLVAAMGADAGSAVETLRVDGGMVANDWMLEFLAGVLDLTVERPAVTETTALGAASLAALGLGLTGFPQPLEERWALGRRFEPGMDAGQRGRLLDGWRQALARVRTRG